MTTYNNFYYSIFYYFIIVVSYDKMFIILCIIYYYYYMCILNDYVCTLLVLYVIEFADRPCTAVYALKGATTNIIHHNYVPCTHLLAVVIVWTLYSLEHIKLVLYVCMWYVLIC